MSTEVQPYKPLVRVPTGVPGLDTVLHGGLFRGGVYMILGQPGAGKTILGNQISFAHTAAGGRAVFLTLLTEGHGRMLAHHRSMTYFNPAAVGTSLLYVSGYQPLEESKLKGLFEVIQKVVLEHKATLLVVDGLITVGHLAESDLELKKFIYGLQVLAELVSCTTLLLTGASKTQDEYPLRTMVDGMLEISFSPVGMETARTIQPVKMRGSDFLAGQHPLRISNAGITVYPRIESLLGRDPSRPAEGQPPLGFGIESFDASMGGGLPAGSVTMVLGSPGTGKTLLGLKFLTDGALRKEPGLYFGFFETESELVNKAGGTGFALLPHLDRVIEIMWQPPFELIADALAEQLLADVKKRGVKRLFIDGLGGFKDSLVDPTRAAKFFGALCNELRSLGVTTILSDETRDLFGTEIEVPVPGLTAMLDNIIFLRHVELHARLRRLISIMKMRAGPCDTSLREFSIGADGIDVAATFESAEAIVTGVAHSIGEPSRPSPSGSGGRRRK